MTVDLNYGMCDVVASPLIHPQHNADTESDPCCGHKKSDLQDNGLYLH